MDAQEKKYVLNKTLTHLGLVTHICGRKFRHNQHGLSAGPLLSYKQIYPPPPPPPPLLPLKHENVIWRPFNLVLEPEYSGRTIGHCEWPGSLRRQATSGYGIDCPR